MLFKFLRTFEVRLSRPLGPEVVSEFRLRRSLKLSNLFDRPVDESNFEKSVVDPTDSGVGVYYQSKGLTLSFPSMAQILVNGQTLHQPDAACLRTALTLAESRVPIHIRFPNQAELTIKSRESNREDAIKVFKNFAPFSWVLIGHLIVLTGMLINIGIRETPTLNRINLDRIETRVVGPNGGLVGAPSSPTTTPNTASLMKSLDQLIRRPIRGSGARYSGFSHELKTGPAEGHSERITFDAPEIEDLPELNISADEIRRALLSKETALQDCYNDVLIRDSSLQGRPQIVLDISQSGAVEAVSINYLTGRPQSLGELQQCFRKVLRSLRLPPANQAFAVTQTLILAH